MNIGTKQKNLNKQTTRHTMKKLFTAFLLISFFCVNAQITLDQTYKPVVGDQYNTYLIDNYLNEGASGANATWDFSTAHQYDTVFTEVKSLASSPNSFKYPNANAVITQGSDYYYNEVDNSGISMWGYDNSTLGTAVYTDKQVLVTFPFTYNSTITDSVKGTGEYQSFATYRKGQSVSTADAYGTITLPGGASFTALRIKTVMTGRDSINFLGTPTIVNSQLTSYSYYAQGVNYPVFTINYVNVNGSPIDTFLTASGPLIASVKSKTEISISVFPNPTSEIIYVNTAENFSAVYLTDLNGNRLNAETSLNGNSAIVNVSSIPAGIYILEASTLKGISKEKIIIRK